MTARPAGDADLKAGSRRGLFDDPLSDWPNDDVLQTKEARAALGSKHLGALRVLDWPELRLHFAKYDPPASRHAQRDRRFGLWSAGLAAFGLALALLSPLGVGAERIVETAAALLILAGLAMMGVHRLGTRSRARALAQRFGAERLRALYFQALANNLGLASRAMRDDVAFGQWKAVRARTLACLPAPEDLPGRIPKLADPVLADVETWVAPEWSEPPEPPAPSAELDLLLSMLRGQRLDTQIDYGERKLSASLGAPGQRAAAARLLSILLVTVAAGTAVMAGVLIAMGKAADGAHVKLALETSVGAIVAAAALRIINDPQLLAGDAKRSSAYFAALSNARARFDTGDVLEKQAALREVEVICYRDLREFVAAHWRPR